MIIPNYNFQITKDDQFCDIDLEKIPPLSEETKEIAVKCIQDLKDTIGLYNDASAYGYKICELREEIQKLDDISYVTAAVKSVLKTALLVVVTAVTLLSALASCLFPTVGIPVTFLSACALTYLSYAFASEGVQKWVDGDDSDPKNGFMRLLSAILLTPIGIALPTGDFISMLYEVPQKIRDLRGEEEAAEEALPDCINQFPVISDEVLTFIDKKKEKVELALKNRENSLKDDAVLAEKEKLEEQKSEIQEQIDRLANNFKVYQKAKQRVDEAEDEEEVTEEQNTIESLQEDFDLYNQYSAQLNKYVDWEAYKSSVVVELGEKGEKLKNKIAKYEQAKEELIVIRDFWADAITLGERVDL